MCVIRQSITGQQKRARDVSHHLYLPAKCQLEGGPVVRAWHVQPVSVQNICIGTCVDKYNLLGNHYGYG